MTRAEQKAATHEELLRLAERLFATHGYAAVSIPTVVAAAGLTKGAVYHHFPGKAALFEAVLERVQQGVAEQVEVAAAAAGGSWPGLIAGCRAFLSASTAPSVRQIMLIDGPAVLGWERWRQLDEATSAQHLADAVSALIQDGTLAERPVQPVVRLLSGAMNEAALWLAARSNADDLDEAMDVLEAMLTGLR